ncbi:MAG: CoA-binding protein [Candidatus Nanopelagicales bacterium]
MGTEAYRRPDLYGTDETVREILRDGQTWFVVGLSDNRMRDAYRVASMLRSHGKRIVAVHPRAVPVFGEPAYATLGEAAAAEGAPDVVEVFVNSTRAGAIADEAVAVGAGAVWFQFDVVDEAAAARVRDAGIPMVMDRCPVIDWPRLGPAA